MAQDFCNGCEEYVEREHICDWCRRCYSCCVCNDDPFATFSLVA